MQQSDGSNETQQTPVPSSAQKSQQSAAQSLSVGVKVDANLPRQTSVVNCWPNHYFLGAVICKQAQRRSAVAAYSTPGAYRYFCGRHQYAGTASTAIWQQSKGHHEAQWRGSRVPRQAAASVTGTGQEFYPFQTQQRGQRVTVQVRRPVSLHSSEYIFG